MRKKKKKVVMMLKSFKDSLKALEDDIQLAITLASDYPQEYDGVCLQMRLSYRPGAHLFLFLVQWTDCHLAGSLGLLRVLIYKAYVNGKTPMSIPERKASIKQFYGVLFPTLLQLRRGVSDVEEGKQRELCATKYKKNDENDRRRHVEIDSEIDEECGICMEIDSKIVLPHCSHSMCTYKSMVCLQFEYPDTCDCFLFWGCSRRTSSQSCPFCRGSLKRVKSSDLLIYTSRFEIVDVGSIRRENMKRLILFLEKLPLVVLDPAHISHDPYCR